MLRESVIEGVVPRPVHGELTKFYMADRSKNI